MIVINIIETLHFNFTYHNGKKKKKYSVMYVIKKTSFLHIYINLRRYSCNVYQVINTSLNKVNEKVKKKTKWHI